VLTKLPVTTAGELDRNEQSALERFAEGWSREEIANHLGVGPRAAQAHLSSACAKLGARSRPHAATLLVAMRRLARPEDEGRAADAT